MDEDHRIFISYAHHDGAELAPLRVQQDLTACRIDAWPDNQRLDAGGAAGTPPPTKERGATMIQTVLYQMAP
jgi:hypothetical protein